MDEVRLLTGWGLTPRSSSRVRRPEDVSEIVLHDGPRGHLARGLGRAYGDAALNGGGSIWDMTGLRTLEFDEANAVARVGAGVSFLQLLEASIRRGLFPPVTPGTKHVTLGGAIAADVHGKNHHRDGSIGHHLESITVLTGSGEIVETGPNDEMFLATVGGMGLTGIIVETTIRLMAIRSAVIEVDTVRTADLGATLEVMTQRDARYRYSVAWVDLTHSKHPGRGAITFGDHVDSGPSDGWQPKRPLASVPNLLPVSLVNKASVKAFNEAKYRNTPRERPGEIQTIDGFFYPLDVAGHWNRLYGRMGFIQYQMVVPFGCEDVVEETVAAIQAAPVPASLAVLKRMGTGRGLLSFPIPGWTLAVDFPASDRELNRVLDRIDLRVSESGGRVYLAKDSRLRPELLPAMYPELERWRELADKADPQRRFRSDLDRRLGLRGSK